METNQKMLIIFGIACVFTSGRCTDDQNVLTQTVHAGEDVTLTCSRQTSVSGSGTLFWIKVAAGNLPEVLGATYTFDNSSVINKTPGITVKQEPGTFVLHILKAQLTDTAFYYCEKHAELQITFLNITFLRVKGPELHITVFQDFPSDPVRPGDLVTLQCSVLFDNKTCLQEHSVYWFRTRSDDSHPSVVYAHLSSGDHCKRSPEISSSQKCVYNLSRNVSSSDAGTYYCAVATCGEILFGSGTKLEVEAADMWSFSDCRRANAILILLCVVLALSLLISILIYTTMKNKYGCFSAAALQTNAPTPQNERQRQQTAEDSLVYSVPNFARRKAGHDVRRDANVAEGQSIYADVRVLE